MEKVKVKKYFNNVFLMSVLFHMVLLTLLNIQRIQRISFVKDNLIGLVPLSDYFIIPQKEAEPKQNEAKVNLQIDPKINPDINIEKVIKEAGQENVIEKMPIDERDLQEEQNKNKLLEIITNFGEKEFADEIIGKADLSIFWKTGSSENTENNKEGINSREENIAGGFGRKKIAKDSRGEEPGLNKPLDLGVFEKSNKITITTVRVWIDSKGKVIKAEICKSSGHIELDQLALNNIRKRYFIPDKNEPVRIAVIEIDFTNIR